MNSFFYANIFVLSGWTKFYKVIKPRAQVIFFCVSGLYPEAGICRPSRTWLFTLCFAFFFLLRSLKHFPCVVSQPHLLFFFFFSHSRSPITRSDLEFTASNNCLMDPHVYTAWHRHPEVSWKSPISTTVPCFLPAFKKRGKKKRKKGKASGTFFPGTQGSSEWSLCFSHWYSLTKFWEILSPSALTKNAHSQVFFQYLLYR